MKTSTIEKLVNNISHAPGWLTAVGIMFGPHVERYAEGYHDHTLNYFKEAEKYWKSTQSDTHKKIKEFKEDNVDFAKECRERHREGLANKLKEKEKDLELLFEKRASTDVKEKAIKEVEYLTKVVNNYLTPDMIQRAEEFPIEQLLEVGKNGRAKCVFHGGEDYNMDIRKNYAHCYVCSETGNAIKVLMKKDNLNFKEAVIRLQ